MIDPLGTMEDERRHLCVEKAHQKVAYRVTFTLPDSRLSIHHEPVPSSQRIPVLGRFVFFFFSLPAASFLFHRRTKSVGLCDRTYLCSMRIIYRTYERVLPINITLSDVLVNCIRLLPVQLYTCIFFISFLHLPSFHSLAVRMISPIHYL